MSLPIDDQLPPDHSAERDGGMRSVRRLPCHGRCTATRRRAFDGQAAPRLWQGARYHRQTQGEWFGCISILPRCINEVGMPSYHHVIILEENVAGKSCNN